MKLTNVTLLIVLPSSRFSSSTAEQAYHIHPSSAIIHYSPETHFTFAMFTRTLALALTALSSLLITNAAPIDNVTSVPALEFTTSFPEYLCANSVQTLYWRGGSGVYDVQARLHLQGYPEENDKVGPNITQEQIHLSLDHSVLLIHGTLVHLIFEYSADTARSRPPLSSKTPPSASSTPFPSAEAAANSPPDRPGKSNLES